ncbi:recombinase family protein, partial [Pseudomonas savastanoi]|uniref:recombinase family protein n=1 Tax=Pseudomonas savastanoi TaxID=29438 RepID=UPI002109AA8F
MTAGPNQPEHKKTDTPSSSTDDQDASRARDYLETFVSGYGKAIASCYMENASGSHADRPELIRLLKDARRGDVLLVESIDRLSRMDDQAWRSLKTAIDNRGIRVTTCNRNGLDLQSSRFSTGIDCVYPAPRTSIDCKRTCIQPL